MPVRVQSTSPLRFAGCLKHVLSYFKPGARNAGIRATTGEYIVPLDADDELLPDYLERMVEALDRLAEASPPATP